MENLPTQPATPSVAPIASEMNLTDPHSIISFPSESAAVDWLAAHPLAHPLGRLILPAALVGSRTYLIRHCATEAERLAAEDAQRVHGRQSLLSYRRHATARWMARKANPTETPLRRPTSAAIMRQVLRDRVAASKRGEPPAQLGEDVL